MRPAVDALSASFRVLTFSLDDADASRDRSKKADGNGLQQYADYIASLMSRASAERAIVCGVSFGGLVAVRFAARFPARCEALILASTPRPVLRLRPRHQVYLRAPW